jgi:hypothetical protein
VQLPQGSGPLAIRSLGESSGFRFTLWAFGAEHQEKSPPHSSQLRSLE